MEKTVLENNIRERARSTFKTFNVEYFDDDVAIVSDIELKGNTDTLRTPRNVFYFCHRGSITIETAEAQYTLSAGETFICPTGTFLRLKHYNRSAKFSVLGLTDRILQSLLNTNMHLWNNIVYVLKERVAKPTSSEEQEEETKMGILFAQMMRALLSLNKHPFRKEMIYVLLQMGLLGFCGRQQEVVPTVALAMDSGTTQSQIIFTRFMELLQKEPVKHQPVRYYAEKLCISSKYLSYVCKTVSDKSASDFIQDAVIGEIMHYLENTTLSVKEIACQLGFPNISFFGKFVKTHLGVSPNNYRK